MKAIMKNLPNNIYSGAYKEGHVQGIAVDTERGYVYYSFTTMFLKTDMLGNPIGSVIKLAGHLGCITYDAKRNAVYGSLELKHDSIGAGIISRTGWDPSAEDCFYLVCFDCDAITKMNMDAEADGVMKAVYLSDVVKDYTENDEVSGRAHRYGCSGIDGTGLGPVFSASTDSPEKIMIAYGIYGETDRADNDYQVILQYDPSVIERFGQPLNQASPHHSGPESCEEKYFFYTGNTCFGIQNLEYDPYTDSWFVAVYRGKKTDFDNFNMFFIDGKTPAKVSELSGRKGETGPVLTSASLGVQGKQENIRGTAFAYGQTGMASMGDGTFLFSHHGSNKETREFYTNIKKYVVNTEEDNIFLIEE